MTGLYIIVIRGWKEEGEGSGKSETSGDVGVVMRSLLNVWERMVECKDPS